MEGRWTINDIKLGFGPNASMGGAMPDRDAFPIPVVPCDDAAVERATQAVVDNYSYDPDDDPNWARDLAEAVLRAAGKTS